MPLAAAIPLIAGVASLAGTGVAIHQGQQAKSAQKKALRQQEEAQRLATARAASEQRRQEMEQRRLRQRRADVSSLLGAERAGALTGPGATTLTSVGGVGRDRLRLGRSSLLGVS